jgi:hypothetical protein
MIAGVSSGGQVGVVAITALRYAQSDGAPIVMPVRPAEQIFANFRHILVRPDTRLEDGVPLYKLKILDALIDSFSRTPVGGAGGSVASSGSPARAGLPVMSVDQKIDSLAREMRREESAGASYRVGLLPEPGAFVDLVA